MEKQGKGVTFATKWQQLEEIFENDFTGQKANGVQQINGQFSRKSRFELLEDLNFWLGNGFPFVTYGDINQEPVLKFHSKLQQ